MIHTAFDLQLLTSLICLIVTARSVCVLPNFCMKIPLNQLTSTSFLAGENFASGKLNSDDNLQDIPSDLELSPVLGCRTVLITMQQQNRPIYFGSLRAKVANGGHHDYTYEGTLVQIHPQLQTGRLKHLQSRFRMYLGTCLRNLPTAS